KMENDGTLTYPDFGLARVAENKQPVELTPATREWAFDHAEYEHVGTITASIEGREDFDGDLIGVFVDGECRGIGERMHFSLDDSYMYIIQTYSNMVEGEELHFKYLDSASDEVIEFEETLTFENNMVVGDGFNTFALSREVGDNVQPNAFGISDAYPNPFNPVTSFSYSVPTDGMVHVSVHDVNGRLVAELVNGYVQAGTHPVTWDAGNLSSGLYLIKMLANEEHVAMQKIMLIK
ncbi:MAG: T9SS type A sorting domain-containing protein, partial [Candidatus Neomarinimicrobiota bacterium]|nr:T9SS type A sorting domain-containing protein [Candidatus Neomarinimicrobiota bacterium]